MITREAARPRAGRHPGAGAPDAPPVDGEPRRPVRRAAPRQVREPPEDGLLQAARRGEPDRPARARRRSARGVIVMSAGNLAQGVAYAARQAGVRCWVSMLADGVRREDRRGAGLRRRGRPPPGSRDLVRGGRGAPGAARGGPHRRVGGRRPDRRLRLDRRRDPGGPPGRGGRRGAGGRGHPDLGHRRRDQAPPAERAGGRGGVPAGPARARLGRRGQAAVAQARAEHRRRALVAHDQRPGGGHGRPVRRRPRRGVGGRDPGRDAGAPPAGEAPGRGRGRRGRRGAPGRPDGARRAAGSSRPC